MFFKFGLAVGTYFNNKKKTKQIAIIAKDTRLSGYALEPALVSGLTSAGMHVFTFGPLPTNGLAMLTKKMRANMGIMITASHNPYTDNGVKLMYYDGTMLSPDDELFMVESVEKKIAYKSLLRKSTLVIGMDTRETSEEIKQLIIRGIHAADEDSTIVDLGLVTTPELHHETYRHSYPRTAPYLTAYFSQIPELEYPHVVVDCANGVGALRMRDIVDKHDLQNNIILHHTDTTQASVLNHKCGSDFVVSHGDSTFCMMDHVLHASLDGDADRIVCYYSENGLFRLLDGDYISALFAYYFYKRVNTSGLRVGVVHTGYANSRFLTFIHSFGFETRCTATGVKHLHRAAEEYDIGIYFESNGHGTVLLKEPYMDEDLSQFINPLIGCLLYTSPSPRDLSTSRMPSSA